MTKGDEMINLVGLGNTGSKIVTNLSEYSQYNVITIDSGKEIKEQKTPEDYEKKCPSFKKLFKPLKGETYLFLSASGNISGAALRILEQLKGAETNVVCIHSDPITLSPMGSLQQNLVSNVLQEYARSGLLRNLYLIDNSKIEDMMGEIELDKYWQKINEVISYIFHTVMCLRHTKPMLESAQQDEGIANIRTFAIMDEKENIKKCYDLAHITAETYLYSYSKERDGKNKNFLKDIKTKMAQQEGNTLRAFKIFENPTEDKTTYIEVCTHILQYVENN